MKQIQTLLKERKQRGYAIGMTEQIKEKNGVWIVPSASNPNKTYQVTLTLEGGTCTCEDFVLRQIKCKHYFAVQYTITKTQNKDGTITVTQTKRVTYPQNWKAYDKASIQQKELFLKLLNDLCKTIEEKPYTFGRPKLPMRDMVFSSALKVYSTFSLRRFSTDMRDAKDKGLIAVVPYYSTVARYMENSELTQILNDLITTSSLPLRTIESSFGIDSTGFSPSKFSRWFSHKYGQIRDRKIWYKLHLVNGNATHIITSCEVTTQFISDMNELPKLTEETHANFDMKQLSADKGYLSDNNLMFLDKLGIAGYIPFKTNTAPITDKQSKNYHSDIWRNAYNYFAMHQSGFMQHYHQRSNTETVMHMVKSKFGDGVRSKSEIACINEILLKALCHNICVLIQEMFELGIKPEFLGA